MQNNIQIEAENYFITIIKTDDTIIITPKQPLILHTNGSGYWSKAKKEVKITKINWYSRYANILFDINTWNTNEYGLIYTDDLFEKELNDYFKTILNKDLNITYTEQGMQEDNYVSMEHDIPFLELIRILIPKCLGKNYFYSIYSFYEKLVSFDEDFYYNYPR